MLMHPSEGVRHFQRQPWISLPHAIWAIFILCGCSSTNVYLQRADVQVSLALIYA